MELSTPALLFPAIAILTLGYINRYIGVANVIRSFAKDYGTGHIHVEILHQIRILKKRIELCRYMLTISATALIFACLSMLFIFWDRVDIGQMSFAASIIFMILSLAVSLYETSLSNKSLMVEIKDIEKQELKQ